MKIPLPCFRCVFGGEGATASVPDARKIYDVQVTDDGIYDLTCDHGHQTRVAVQEEKFQMLFEIALNAIVDGYYRDAVASATASLERFYQFVIELVSFEAKVDASELEAAWRPLGKQSERQLGAFVAAHLLHFHRAPKLLHQRKVEFRNEVIHKGSIPTKQQAIDYVQDVFDLIVPLIDELRSNHHEAIRAVTSINRQRRHRLAPDGSCGYMTIGPIFRLLAKPEDTEQPTVAEKLALIARSKHRGWKIG